MSRRPLLLSGILILSWLSTQIVSPLLAQQNTDAGKAEASAAADEERELNIRYAQAYLKLMEARLAEFEQRNRRVSNTILPAATQLAKEYVTKAKVRLDAAENNDASESRIYVVRAEAALRSAEAELRRAVEVNKKLANGVSRGEMARLVAQRDLARVKLEKAKHLASESPLSNLQFEIDQLREDVQELLLRDTMSRRGS